MMQTLIVDNPSIYTISIDAQTIKPKQCNQVLTSRNIAQLKSRLAAFAHAKLVVRDANDALTPEPSDEQSCDETSSIDVLDLTAAIKNKLLEHDITTIAELVIFSQADLDSLDGVGSASIKSIIDALNKFGFTLSSEDVNHE